MEKTEDETTYAPSSTEVKLEQLEKKVKEHDEDIRTLLLCSLCTSICLVITLGMIGPRWGK